MTTINNLKQLIALKERYGVGNMEIADLIEYSHTSVDSWFRSSGSRILRTPILNAIKLALKSKYPSK